MTPDLNPKAVSDEFRKRQRWHLALVGVAWIIAVSIFISLRSAGRPYFVVLLVADVVCVTADVCVWRCPFCRKSLGRRVWLEDCPRCHARL